jgi:hypothetical protein
LRIQDRLGTIVLSYCHLENRHSETEIEVTVRP